MILNIENIKIVSLIQIFFIEYFDISLLIIFLNKNN